MCWASTGACCSSEGRDAGRLEEAGVGGEARWWEGRRMRVEGFTAALNHPAFPNPTVAPPRCASSHAILRHAPRLTKLCLMSMGKLELEAGGCD